MPDYATNDKCIFCKVIDSSIPCEKLLETEHTIAFLDIRPVSSGHLLVVPKYHAAKLHLMPEEYLTEVLPMLRKLTLAVQCEDYNLLQSNGKIAYQTVDHVHFHLVPKPADRPDEGLLLRLPDTFPPADNLKEVGKEIRGRL